ncbi:MAG: hypothetical protein H6735_30280 [Alphaproteobacteria bacterium]|nr:hypothetical protein [Alphaproteobacteria bacterium]
MPPWIHLFLSPMSQPSPVLVSQSGGGGGTPNIWIEDVQLETDVYSIDGPNARYTVTIRNDDPITYDEVVYQAWFEQGAAARAACGAKVTCSRRVGELPADRSCRNGFVIGTNDHAAGHGSLVPGPALARIDLSVEGRVVDTVVLPITLIAPP